MNLNLDPILVSEYVLLFLPRGFPTRVVLESQRRIGCSLVRLTQFVFILLLPAPLAAFLLPLRLPICLAPIFNLLLRPSLRPDAPKLACALPYACEPPISFRIVLLLARELPSVSQSAARTASH